MTEANDICRMDTVTLARRIKAKELSPVEVVEAVLGRLERLDPVLHAFTTVTADEARAEARRIEDEERSASDALAAHGADELADHPRILTHCNTGALAAPGRGTKQRIIWASL